MKTHDYLLKPVQHGLQKRLSLNIEEVGSIARTYKYIKKYLLISCIAGTGFLLSSCFPGYMASVPADKEFSRPSRPSTVHVWVDGNWVWSRQSKIYVQTNGYWHKEKHGRKFVAGHWVSTPKGHKWIKGHWQRHRR